MNAAKKALTQVLPGLADKVFDYASSDDFEKLWSFAGLPADWIVIVWGRTAGDGTLWPIDASACLSPLDWAAAYVKSLSSETSWPEVLIIDAAPRLHWASPSRAHFCALRTDQLPWLTLVQDVRLKAIMGWLNTGATSSSARDENCNAALKRFLREIRMNLSSAGFEDPDAMESTVSHHSISNIVSPMILLNEDELVIQGGKSLHAPALMRLLRACGLTSHHENVGQDDLKSAKLEILLVDDQAEHGWAQWLNKSFPESKIEYLKSPTDLLTELETQWDKRPVGRRDLRFQFQLPKLPGTNPPVLFLDLRLFAGNWAVEKAFIARLLTFVEKHEDSFCGEGRLPIATVPTLKEWLKAKPIEGDALHFEAMLLLPKVLAITDMSLPIVLFSSTSKRDLVSPLSNYKNVFSDLRKDAVHRQGGTEPDVYLASILSKLLGYGEWRRKFTELSKADAISKSGPEFSHWEVYIDESGAPEGKHFRVAGLLMGYRNVQDAENLHAEMESLRIRWRGDHDDDIEWKEDSTVWLGKPRNDSNRSQYNLDKQWDSISNKLEELTCDHPKYSFCLFRAFENGSDGGHSPHTEPKLCDPGSLDNQFFSLLNNILEACLIDVLDAVNSANPCTVGIFAGTRLRVLKEAVDRPSQLDKWLRSNREKYAAFGVAINRHYSEHPSYQALPAEGILPVVSELLEKRSGRDIAAKLKRGIVAASAIPMNQPLKRNSSGKAKYFKTANGVLFLESPPFRHLHFIADMMASLASTFEESVGGIKLHPNNYRVLTQSSFGFGKNGANKGLFGRIGKVDQGISCLLRISRLLDPEDANVVLAAWLFWQMEGTVTESLDKGLFANSVLHRLKESLERDLTGVQLSQLVQAHSEPRSLAVQLIRGKDQKSPDRAGGKIPLQSQGSEQCGVARKSSSERTSPFRFRAGQYLFRRFVSFDDFLDSRQAGSKSDGVFVQILDDGRCLVVLDKMQAKARKGFRAVNFSNQICTKIGTLKGNAVDPSAFAAKSEASTPAQSKTLPLPTRDAPPDIDDLP